MTGFIEELQNSNFEKVDLLTVIARKDQGDGCDFTYGPGCELCEFS